MAGATEKTNFAFLEKEQKGMIHKIGAMVLGFSMVLAATAQTNKKTEQAFRNFLNDSQMQHGITSLYVVNSRTGEVVFSHNEQTGLSTASTLKVVTASTAFDVLGQDFRFRTPIYTSGITKNGMLQGDVFIGASGDPTLASWRYDGTKNFIQLRQLADAFQQKGITQISGNWQMDESGFSSQTTPGGWTFDDMGNYYGAGAAGFNWYENQYDLKLKPGANPGQPVAITGTSPIPNAVILINELTSGPKGSGDRAIIYPDRWPGGTVRGTVPAGVSSFTISGSIADPRNYFFKSIQDFAAKNQVDIFMGAQPAAAVKGTDRSKMQLLTEWKSPLLDSIVYWFLQKSINLYGEALLKQLSLGKTKIANTSDGADFIQDYWKMRGIEPSALRVIDGSGLSPQNRVTTHALVTILQYARKREWFPAFYDGLPIINGLKMKSGSISGVKGYTGYVTSSDGNTYTFAFLVNNFDGSSGAITQKMFRVLDVLK